MLFGNLDVATLLSRLVILVIAFTVHEFSHAWTANALGDTTPEANGRLTLNPGAHLDIMGSLMLLIAGFGWAKPVPINPYALTRRTPAGVMWVSLAGPASNFLMAMIAAIPLRLGLVPVAFTQPRALIPTPYAFLSEFIWINLALLVFNLIPLAPLDGEKVAEYFLPPNIARYWEAIRPYGPVILIALLFLGPMVGLDVIGRVM
ncbi:MAG TPA: site-2 protease family protein, partial [Anaerolineaceae bacterium]